MRSKNREAIKSPNFIFGSQPDVPRLLRTGGFSLPSVVAATAILTLILLMILSTATILMNQSSNVKGKFLAHAFATELLEYFRGKTHLELKTYFTTTAFPTYFFCSHINILDRYSGTLLNPDPLADLPSSQLNSAGTVGLNGRANRFYQVQVINLRTLALRDDLCDDKVDQTDLGPEERYLVTVGVSYLSNQTPPQIERLALSTVLPDNIETPDPPDTPPPPAGGPHHIFVSSRMYRGDFFTSGVGGFAYADGECTDMGTNSPLAAINSHPNWMAVLSDDSTDAASRITVTQDVLNSRDNRVDRPSGWFSGGISALVNRNESGNSVGGGDKNVWTGMRGNGTRQPGITCNSWTSNSGGNRGVAGGTRHNSGQWLSDSNNEGNEPCNRDKRLYCISQP